MALRQIVTGVRVTPRHNPNQLKLTLAPWVGRGKDLAQLRRALATIFPGCRPLEDLTLLHRMTVHKSRCQENWHTLSAEGLHRRLEKVDALDVIADIKSHPSMANVHLIFFSRCVTHDDYALLRQMTVVDDVIFVNDYGETVIGVVISQRDAQDRIGSTYTGIRGSLRIGLDFAEEA